MKLALCTHCTFLHYLHYCVEVKRVKRGSFLLWVLLVDLLLGPARPVSAEVYRRVDPSGVVYYSNIPPSFLPATIDRTQGPLTPFREMIAAAAFRHGVDSLLIEAIVAVESNFNPWAISPKGAMGLMQLMPETAQRYAVHNPFDPLQNITGGTRYLRDLLYRFDGDLPQALAAYNAGETAVLRYGGIPPYRETREYVQKVLTRSQARPHTLSRPTSAFQVYRSLTPEGLLRYSNLPPLSSLR
jgi:soluble lytic murein transglycosylase